MKNRIEKHKNMFENMGKEVIDRRFLIFNKE